MAFLYEYMTDDELQFAREQAVFENESRHLDNEMAILCMEHELRLHDIDTSAILENYTEDDLTALYKKEMVVFTEGVKEWWEKFKDWFKGVIDALLGKHKTEPPKPEEADEEVDLSVDLKKANTIADKFLAALKKPFNFKKDDGSLDYGKICGEAAITGFGALLTGGGILFRKNKMKKKEAEKEKNDLLNKGKEAQNIVDSARFSDNEEGQKEATLAKEIATNFNRFIDFVLGKAKKVGKAVKDKAEEVGKKITGKDKKDDGKKEPEEKPVKNEEGTVTVEDAKKAQHVLLSISKNWKIHNPSDGNTIKIDEMKKVVSEAKKKVEANPDNKIKDKIPEWEKVIKWMEENNINECTVEEMDGYLYTEFAMDSLDVIDYNYDVESFLESHSEEDIDELISLVDNI